MQDSIGGNAGEVRVVRSVVALVPVGPFPLEVNVVVALVVAIVKGPASLPSVISRVEARELSAIIKVKMASAVPVLLYIGGVERLLSGGFGSFISRS